jgi:hypothetical protein
MFEGSRNESFGFFLELFPAFGSRLFVPLRCTKSAPTMPQSGLGVCRSRDRRHFILAAAKPYCFFSPRGYTLPRAFFYLIG